jgi:hypothetical protein
MPSNSSRFDGYTVGLFLVLVASPLSTRAEGLDDATRLRITGWAGLQLTSNVSTAGGTASINGAPSYGAAVAVAVDPEFELEALWTISNTEAHFVPYAATASSALPNNLVVNYFQLGITKTNRYDTIEVFGEITAGLVLLSPSSVVFTTGEVFSVNDTWNFAFTLAAGVRFFVVDKLALVLQARLLVPVYITSGGFYSGPSGAALVIGGGIPCVQGAFSAGLALAL